jgi:hypothetical protein
VATEAKSTFDINIRRASHFLDIHQQVHAGTHGAPVLALRELPRGAVVFAVGALDAYLSDVSAEVMIHQCEHGLVTGDTRGVMKTVSHQLPGLALELAVASEGVDRVERLRAAIVDHFQTAVSGHGPESVARVLERMSGRASELWRGLEEAGFTDPAKALDQWTDKRHRIVHRGEKVSVPWKQGRECLELLTAVAGAVDLVAERAMTTL